jgi:hypothetical protein
LRKECVARPYNAGRDIALKGWHLSTTRGASRGTVTGERVVDKCLGCNYYDRQAGKETDTRGVQWGQCRRTAPALHPINQKSYMIEGVWPHVRDDDWCGEWKAGARRQDSRTGESVPLGPLIPVPSGAALGARPAPKPSLASSGGYPAAPVNGGFLSSSGRGD